MSFVVWTVHTINFHEEPVILEGDQEVPLEKSSACSLLQQYIRSPSTRISVDPQDVNAERYEITLLEGGRLTAKIYNRVTEQLWEQSFESWVELVDFLMTQGVYRLGHIFPSGDCRGVDFCDAEQVVTKRVFLRGLKWVLSLDKKDKFPDFCQCKRGMGIICLRGPAMDLLSWEDDYQKKNSNAAGAAP